MAGAPAAAAGAAPASVGALQTPTPARFAAGMRCAAHTTRRGFGSQPRAVRPPAPALPGHPTSPHWLLSVVSPGERVLSGKCVADRDADKGKTAEALRGTHLPQTPEPRAGKRLHQASAARNREHVGGDRRRSNVGE